MGQVSVIEQAIKSAESGTRTSDAQVTDILRGAGESGAAPPRYAQLLSAAQALLTGDADLALDRRVEVAPYASWGSWIEGVPFSHALLLNEGVLVDLAPCRTEADFVRNYRCSPDQFMDLTRRVIKTRGEIHFNIRDYDPTRPESLEGYRCGSSVSAPRRGWRAADRRWPRHRPRAALQAAGPRRPDPVPRHRPRRPSPRA